MTPVDATHSIMTSCTHIYNCVATMRSVDSRSLTLCRGSTPGDGMGWDVNSVNDIWRYTESETTQFLSSFCDLWDLKKVKFPFLYLALGCQQWALGGYLSNLFLKCNILFDFITLIVWFVLKYLLKSFIGYVDMSVGLDCIFCKVIPVDSFHFI